MDHRHEAFKIEQELQEDMRVLRQIATALKDVTEYPLAVRYATPILVPRDDGMFGVHFRSGGRVTPREWPVAFPTFESIGDKLRRLRHLDGHIVQQW